MSLPRSILFVDGENLVMRFQDSVATGMIPHKEVIHMPDVFVWHTEFNNYHALQKVIRVCYYTSLVGDDVALRNTREAIGRIQHVSRIDDGTNVGQIVPVVFKKPSRSQKTRNVDIQIVIDVMRYAFTDEIDRVYLASGDGDYLPLITEVMRRGKQVEVLAFSSGLNDQLKYSADRFQNLDAMFFANPPVNAS